MEEEENKMKIEEKFNKRGAELLEVQTPTIHVGRYCSDLGMKVTFYRMPGEDGRMIAMHMTPDEALRLAGELIEAVRRGQQ